MRKSSGQSITEATVDVVGSSAARAARPFAPWNQFLGGAFTIQVSTPAIRNSQTISDSVAIVTAAAQIYIAHSSLSLPMLFVVSLEALIAMMPITEAPTP